MVFNYDNIKAFRRMHLSKANINLIIFYKININMGYIIFQLNNDKYYFS